MLMDDVCIDSVASRRKQNDLYASIQALGYTLEAGWSAVVSIRRAGNSAGTKVCVFFFACCEASMRAMLEARGVDDSTLVAAAASDGARRISGNSQCPPTPVQ